ncbi:hypothetical protein Ccrd_000268 [Cynara cardunculus var. scolymus]|uniref:Uncharacterized protein n=1 Tax=Cynara cardunculus var. scolymus TaxID=59895 RepID=A0A103XVF8_CYNCS|nr:hypothetical protein Ccrd_000268 [Cynara cardunculus var. scolymus]
MTMGEKEVAPNEDTYKTLVDGLCQDARLNHVKVVICCLYKRGETSKGIELLETPIFVAAGSPFSNGLWPNCFNYMAAYHYGQNLFFSISLEQKGFCVGISRSDKAELWMVLVAESDWLVLKSGWFLIPVQSFGLRWPEAKLKPDNKIGVPQKSKARINNNKRSKIKKEARGTKSNREARGIKTNLNQWCT